MALTKLDPNNPLAVDILKNADLIARGLAGFDQRYGLVYASGSLGVAEFAQDFGITNGETQALELFTRLTAIHSGDYSNLKATVDQVMADLTPPVSVS
jgi:hypothetical protein